MRSVRYMPFWLLLLLTLPGCLGKMALVKREKASCAPLAAVRLPGTVSLPVVPASASGDRIEDYDIEIREFVNAGPEKSGTTEDDETEACLELNGQQECYPAKITRIFNDVLSEKEYRVFLSAAPHIQGVGSSLLEALEGAMSAYRQTKETP